MKNTEGFNIDAYKNEQFAFPNITFDEFNDITDMRVRKRIIAQNKVLATDTYNRTMGYCREEKGYKQETFSLSFRRTGERGYNIVYGVRKKILELFDMPFTEAEVDFAYDAYKDQAEQGGVGYFDKNLWQTFVLDNDGKPKLTIKAVDDGTMMKNAEPVMLISGPGELAAFFEPSLLKIFYQSIVAGDMHLIESILGEGRVVEFGTRSGYGQESHIDAVEALYVGGGVNLTANDQAAVTLPSAKSAGTLAHRYLASYPTEDEAFLEAVEKTDKIALLIDLVDSYTGIDKAIALKKKYINTEKSIAMRLDSGDLADQAVYALKELTKAGLIDNPLHNKVVVADISSIDDLKVVEAAVIDAGFDPKKHIIYGLGGILVAKNKTRDALSAALKVINTEDGPTGKKSNDIGKEPIPGEPNIEIIYDQEGNFKDRIVVQEHEEVKGERLLKTIMKDGNICFEEDDDLVAIENAREQVKKSSEWITPGETKLSEVTTQIKDQVRDWLNSQSVKNSFPKKSLDKQNNINNMSVY